MINPRFRAIGFHVLMASMIVASQILLTPTRDLNADNTWHFQFARDLVSGERVFWSAVDANRLFPDLLFSAIAFILPDGGRFSVWLYYFYSVVLLSTYVSLVFLARTLVRAASERRAFLILSVSGLLVLTVGLPYWGRWLLNPGNHGAGLSVCLACLALVLWMNDRQKISIAGLLAFVLLASLLVASNRSLLTGFLAPLLVALMVALAVRLSLRRRSDPAERVDRIGPLPALIAATGVACAGGLVGFRTLSSMSWHKLLVRGAMAPFPESSYARWFAWRIKVELLELGDVALHHWDILLGLVLLLATIPAAWLLLRAALRQDSLPGKAENPVILGLVAAAATILSWSFIVILAGYTGDWRYRFLTIPFAIAVVFGASRLVAVPAVSKRQPIVAASLAAVLAVAILAATQGQDVPARDRRFESALDRLADEVGRGRQATSLRGLSDYWLANDVSARSDRLRIVPVQPETMQFRFYNDNAAEICNSDFSFVLYDAANDQPMMSAITARLGPPLRTETFDLVRYPRVQALYYDPRLIEERILAEGRRNARLIFGRFNCARERDRSR